MFNKDALHSHKDVYRGKKLVDGKIHEVVVKLLKETSKRNREIEILRKLADHPNIVRVLDSGGFKGAVPQTFIVMELCLQNLDDYINKNHFDYGKATTFLQQTVSAIVFIHLNHIAHRDLKPSNILVTLDGQNVKVSDFGLSREIQSDRSKVTVTYPGAGTDGFKAPETYLGLPEVGYAVDIYALGICCCIIMTHGKHPFGPNSHKRAGKIADNKNCDLSQIPKFPQPNVHKRSQLIDLLKRMLKPDPNDRPVALRVRDHAYFQGNSSKDILSRQGLLPAFKRSFRLNKRPSVRVRVGLQKQPSEVMPSVDILERVLDELVDCTGSERMLVLLQIVECEIRSKSDNVQISIQRLRNLIPKSYPVTKLIKMSRNLAEEGHCIRSLILFRIANEIYHSQNAASDDTAKWISDLAYDVREVAMLLIRSSPDLRHAAIIHGLKYIEELLRDLRALQNVNDDVRALNETRCLHNISVLNVEADEYEGAFLSCKEGIAGLKSQFGEDASKHKYYGWLWFILGSAYYFTAQYTDAESCYVQAIDAYDKADYENVTEKTDDIDSTNECLKTIRKYIGKNE